MNKPVTLVVRVLLVAAVLAGGWFLGGLRGVASACASLLALWLAMRALLHVFQELMDDTRPVASQSNQPSKFVRCMKTACLQLLSFLVAAAWVICLLLISWHFNWHVNRYSGFLALLFLISWLVLAGPVCSKLEKKEQPSPSSPSCH